MTLSMIGELGVRLIKFELVQERGMHANMRNRLPGRDTLQNNRAGLFCHVIQ